MAILAFFESPKHWTASASSGFSNAGPSFPACWAGSGGIVDGGAVSSKISLASNSDREKTGKSVIEMQQSGH